MKTKETVSLCMIVKNEEDCVLAAIRSVRNLTDELIIVDTGSTDNTRELVLAAGVKLFHLEWTKDFSAARNFALEQAASNWIIVLDADEVLETIDPQAFYELLTDSQVEGYFLRIKNYLDSTISESCDQVVRLFRNRLDYRFEGAIHEQVAPSILKANNGGGLASVPITIHHYGYLRDCLNSKEKFSRNSEIITQELKLNPDNPFLLYCLGLEYYQQDSILEGLNHLKKALTRMSGNEGYFEDALLSIALGYLRLEKSDLLIDFLGKALSMYPGQADFFCLRGFAYFQQSNYCQAVADFERALGIGTIQLTTVYQVNCLLGDAYQASGNYPQAQDAYTRALAYTPFSAYPLHQLISLIRKGYPIECLLERALFGESWPNSESWQEMLTSLKSINLELYLVILVLALYRTFNTSSFCDQELLETISHFLKVLERRITESDDMTQNIACQCLTLALKEIRLCSMALMKDMENAHFVIKHRVNRTLKNTFSILCHLVDQSELVQIKLNI
ncbi:glycosyltransferase [Desulfosporosinus youngiae]|uniref:Glycosyl transferase n=1 Tax=Desulfosporosinus youngiae DSM 17734 TaxID=768710 RepID=H5XRZ9_9FIRM|nr:glycosyltransferase family 2 protein [Desulfosporosinus youngiae]EHQ87536.1 glycosyl transferase [Desulfosporosinus youngiae DSM 17734]